MTSTKPLGGLRVWRRWSTFWCLAAQDALEVRGRVKCAGFMPCNRHIVFVKHNCSLHGVYFHDFRGAVLWRKCRANFVQSILRGLSSVTLIGNYSDCPLTKHGCISTSIMKNRKPSSLEQIIVLFTNDDAARSVPLFVRARARARACASVL